MLLLSRSGAIMLSGTFFLRTGLGLSAFMLLSSLFRVKGSCIKTKNYEVHFTNTKYATHQQNMNENVLP